MVPLDKGELRRGVIKMVRAKQVSKVRFYNRLFDMLFDREIISSFPFVRYDQAGNDFYKILGMKLASVNTGYVLKRRK